MRPNKRKIIEADDSSEDDSFKRRRSSLRVNLSYTSNLTTSSTMDSGNSSLGESHFASDNNKTAIEETPSRVKDFLTNITIRKNMRTGRNDGTGTKYDSNTHGQIIPSSNIYVVVDRMSHSDVRATNNLNKSPNEIVENNGTKSTDIDNNDEALNKSCKQLKDAILKKTREIFDHQNEFSIKTTEVLINGKGTAENFLSRECTSPSHALLGNKRAILSDRSTHSSIGKNSIEKNCSKYLEHEDKSLENVHKARNVSEQNIVNTPKNVRCKKGESYDSLFEGSNSLKRRLFIDEYNRKEYSTEKTTSSFVDDVGNSKSPTLSANMQRNHVGRLSLRSDASSSPILSRNNRRIGLSNLSMKSQHKRVATQCSNEAKNYTSPILSQNVCRLNSSRSFLLSTKEMANISQDLPVTCSSFMDEKEKLTCDEKNSNSKETENDEPTISDVNGNSGSKNTLESMDITQIQGNMLSVDRSSRCLENSCSLLPTKCCVAYGKENLEDESSKLKLCTSNSNDVNLDRASLNMNTSLDAVTSQKNVSYNRELIIPETPKRVTRMNKILRNNEACKAVPMKLTTIQETTVSEENVILSKNVCTSSKSECSKTMIEDPHLKGRRQSRGSLSNNKDESTSSIRTSLTVNTSIDSRYSAVHEEDYRKKIKDNTNYEENSDNAADNVKVKIKNRILETKQNRLHRFRSSMQVNTSLDPICKSPSDNIASKGNEASRYEQENRGIINEHQLVDKSTEEAIETDSERECDFNSLENMSLVERLREKSMKQQVGSNSGCPVKKRRKQLTNVKVQERQNVNGANESNGDGPSYVEGTPYPISRSNLCKSQIKCNTVNSNLDSQSSASDNNLNVDDRESSFDETYRSLEDRLQIPLIKSKPKHTSPSTSKKEISVLRNSVVLDDSSSENESMRNKKYERIIIDDSLEKAESAKNNKEKVSAIDVSKRIKRKLLPLNESSQLVSFSPVQIEQSISKKQKPKSKRYKMKRNIKTRPMECKEIRQKETEDEGIQNSEKLSLNENLDTFQTQKAKPRKRRKVVSKEIIVKKVNNFNALEELEKNKETSIDCDECSVISRNSLNDFTVKRKTDLEGKRSKKDKIVIVTTGLSKGDKNLVKSVIKALGSAKMDLIVTRRTTHVVSSGVRTINLLRGIIRGCWLVSLDWVLKSLECSRWLEPISYEMSHFSKAVKENRRDRQMFGDAYIPELFATCGFVYIENGSTPPAPILKELVKIAGGRIAEKPENAKIIVGLEGLKEIWILDSITTGDLQPFNQYHRN